MGDGGEGRGGVVEVVFPRGCLLQEFAGAVAEQLVQADLNFEGGVAILAVEGLVGVGDEGDGFVGGGGGEDVAQAHVFEAEGLPDVVVVRDVDSCIRACEISMGGLRGEDRGAGRILSKGDTGNSYRLGSHCPRTSEPPDS